MSNVTNQVAQNSNTPAPANPAAGNSNNTAVSMSGATPTSTPVVARKGFRQVLQEMLQGWQTVIPSGSTLQPSGGGTLEQGAVLEQLQAYLGVYTTLDARATSLSETRAQVASQEAAARQYCDGLKSAVIHYFGPTSPQLAQFGLAPKKAPRALTASQLAVKAAKARATRELRGTTGKKQKALVKSGPMQFVEPVQQAAPDSAPQGATAASTAPAVPTVNAASPPAVSK